MNNGVNMSVNSDGRTVPSLDAALSQDVLTEVLHGLANY